MLEKLFHAGEKPISSRCVFQVFAFNVVMKIVDKDALVASGLGGIVTGERESYADIRP